MVSCCICYKDFPVFKQEIDTFEQLLKFDPPLVRNGLLMSLEAGICRECLSNKKSTNARVKAYKHFNH